MLKVNEYFGGTVKSIGCNGAEGSSTVGVIEKGEYEFGTGTVEIMTVISGKMEALLPGETEWKVYKKFESFVVAKDVKFKVRVSEDTPYLCLYK
jgi:uncharacterized protein YaiE (UPF0345 family)